MDGKLYVKPHGYKSKGKERGNGYEATKQSDYRYKFSLKLQGEGEKKECLILMSPKVDFACNIYKILKEKEESSVDVNSAAGFSCP